MAPVGRPFLMNLPFGCFLCSDNDYTLSFRDVSAFAFSPGPSGQLRCQRQRHGSHAAIRCEQREQVRTEIHPASKSAEVKFRMWLQCLEATVCQALQHPWLPDWLFPEALCCALLVFSCVSTLLWAQQVTLEVWLWHLWPHCGFCDGKRWCVCVFVWWGAGGEKQPCLSRLALV